MLKGDKRKGELLAAAEKLFFSKGYSQTSINDILESQHCSKGSFYHHFVSKLDVLTALLNSHAERQFRYYLDRREERNGSLAQLDLLLYSALPVSSSEASMCALLIPLLDTPEGEEVLLSLQAAQRAVFLPEFKRLLDLLRDNKQAFFPYLSLPEVVWDTHASVYRRLLAVAKLYMLNDFKALSAIQELMDAERYLLERTLSLPFGSVTIAPVADCVDTLKRAAAFAAQTRQLKGAS